MYTFAIVQLMVVVGEISNFEMDIPSLREPRTQTSVYNRTRPEIVHGRAISTTSSFRIWGIRLDIRGCKVQIPIFLFPIQLREWERSGVELRALELSISRWFMVWMSRRFC